MSSLALFSPSSSSSASLFLTKQVHPTKGRASAVVRCSDGPTLSGSQEEEEEREGVMVALVGRRNALASAAAACGVSVLGFAGDGLAAAKQGPLAGRIPGLSAPDQNGWRTYRRPDEKSGGHGVGWSPIIPYSFKVPDGWEETPVSIADLGGTEIDLRFGNPKEGRLSVIVAPTRRFADPGNKAGGEKGEESNSTPSKQVVVGAIPLEDGNDDRDVDLRGGQEQMQGEQQDTSAEAIRWSRPNEEQNLQVYTRRHKPEEEQVQGEEISLGEENSEAKIQSDMHDSSSQPSASPHTPLPFSTSDGNNEVEISHLKKMLAKSFEVKDMGYLHYFLGIEVAYGPKDDLDDATIEKIGTPEKVINAFGPEVIGENVEGKVLSTATAEYSGRTYYQFELEPPHIFITATAAGNRLYLFSVTANGLQWKRHYKDLKQIAESFRVV